MDKKSLKIIFIRAVHVNGYGQGYYGNLDRLSITLKSLSEDFGVKKSNRLLNMCGLGGDETSLVSVEKGKGRRVSVTSKHVEGFFRPNFKGKVSNVHQLLSSKFEMESNPDSLIVVATGAYISDQLGNFADRVVDGGKLKALTGVERGAGVVMDLSVPEDHFMSDVLSFHADHSDYKVSFTRAPAEPFIRSWDTNPRPSL